MAEFMDVIKERRSIRNYADKQVPQDLLDRLFEAVRWSPSWANTQCWEVVAVSETDTKQKLQEALAKGNPATRAMVEAPTVLVVCGKLQSSGYYKGQSTTKFDDWFMFDLGLATQSLCLAAHDLGLGTVIVGLFEHDKVKQIVAVPQGYEVLVMIPLGFPARSTSAPKRREVSEFVHKEKF